MTEPPPNQYSAYLSAMEGVQTRINRLSGIIRRMAKAWNELGLDVHTAMRSLPPQTQIDIANKFLVVNGTIEELAETCELLGGDTARVITGVGEIIMWIQKELFKR